MRKVNPWGVWALGVCTFGIYSAYYYSNANAQLAALNGRQQMWYTRMWAIMFIPFCYFVAMSKTNSEMNEALIHAGSPTRGSFPVTLLASCWFGSDIRYLARRLNALAV